MCNVCQIIFRLDGLVVDFFSALVEDDDVLLVEVGHVELSLVDDAVEGVSQSVLVREEKTELAGAGGDLVINLD